MTPKITTCKVSRALKTGRTNTCRPSLFLAYLFHRTIGKQQPSLLDPVSESPAQFCMNAHFHTTSNPNPAASIILPSFHNPQGGGEAGGVMNMSCARGPRAKFPKHDFSVFTGTKKGNLFFEQVFHYKKLSLLLIYL